jgi:hypothetical protein
MVGTPLGLSARRQPIASATVSHMQIHFDMCGPLKYVIRVYIEVRGFAAGYTAAFGVRRGSPLGFFFARSKKKVAKRRSSPHSKGTCHLRLAESSAR